MQSNEYQAHSPKRLCEHTAFKLKIKLQMIIMKLLQVTRLGRNDRTMGAKIISFLCIGSFIAGTGDYFHVLVY